MITIGFNIRSRKWSDWIKAVYFHSASDARAELLARSYSRCCGWRCNGRWRRHEGNLYSSSAYNVKWEVSIGQRTCFSSPVFNDDSHEFPSTTPLVCLRSSGMPPPPPGLPPPVSVIRQVRGCLQKFSRRNRRSGFRCKRRYGEKRKGGFVDMGKQVGNFTLFSRQS